MPNVRHYRLALLIALACASAFAKQPTTAGAVDPNAAAQDAFNQTTQPTITATQGDGEAGAGTVTLNGQAVQMNKLLPGYRADQVQSLQNLSTQANTPDALHALSDQHQQALANDNGQEGQAWVTAVRAGQPIRVQKQQLVSQTSLWQQSIGAIGQADSGSSGNFQPQCTTSYQPDQQPTQFLRHTEEVCDVVKQVPSNLPVCLRELEPDPLHPGQMTVAEHGTCLPAETTPCRTSWVCSSQGTATTSQAQSEALSLTGADGGALVQVSIAGMLPANTTKVTGTQWSQTSGSATAVLTTVPNAKNGWTATFEVTCPAGGHGPGGGGGCPPPPSVCQVPKRNFVPVCTPALGLLTWTSVQTVAQGSGGGALYTGAPSNCNAAEQIYSCPVKPTTVCHDTDAGQVCETVTSRAIDTCGSLRANASCALKRTQCTEGETIGGTCYQENEVYDCATPVTGQDTVMAKQTVCTTQMPLCNTANCTTTTVSTSPADTTSAAHAMASLSLLEDIRLDYTDLNPPPISGGGPGGPGGPGGTGGGPPGGGGNGGGTQPQAIRAGSGIHAMDAPGSSGTGSNGLGGIVIAGTPLPDGFSPWNEPTDTGTTSNPGQAGSVTPPAGWNPALMSFFAGSSQDCMKILGGLYDCCSKQAPATGDVAWWQIFQSQMRSGWAGVAQCTTPNTQGAWASMGSAGTTMTNLTKGFTSTMENLNGGGSSSQCQSASNMTMTNVNNQWLGVVQTKITPGLGWYCNQDQKTLAVRKKLGQCTYLGDYCKTKILGDCVDKRQRYCCFNSPMSKIIRDQMNTQGLSSYGTPKHPNCAGVPFTALENLNLSNVDTSDLEGNMVEAGAVPDFGSLVDSTFLNQITGSGSMIGNPGRQDVVTRTKARLSQVDVGASLTSLDNEVATYQPNPAQVTEATPGPGNVTIANANVIVHPGHAFDVVLTRSGGVGAVSVTITASNGTALSGIDYRLYPSKVVLTWGNNDTSTRTVHVWTMQPTPPTTVPKQFEIVLSAPIGGVQIYPTAIQDVTISP
jgi:conjugal transfer mating pair stabilization protein TraN